MGPRNRRAPPHTHARHATNCVGAKVRRQVSEARNLPGSHAKLVACMCSVNGTVCLCVGHEVNASHASPSNSNSNSIIRPNKDNTSKQRYGYRRQKTQVLNASFVFWDKNRRKPYYKATAYSTTPMPKLTEAYKHIQDVTRLSIIHFENSYNNKIL